MYRFILALLLAFPMFVKAGYPEGFQALMEGDYKAAFNEFMLEAKQENPFAQADLGDMYYHGVGVEQDDIQAFNWYGMAAEQGMAESQSILGDMLVNGRGVAEDSLKAIEWFNKAAEQGYAKAFGCLSQIYQTGTSQVEPNGEKAIQCLNSAVELDDTEAMLTLAYFYSNGIAFEQSDEKSNILNFKAFDLGSPKAAYNLGISFERGRGVEVDYQRASSLYLFAAKAGLPLAMHNLAALHFNKSIEPNDIELAKFLYMSASSLGSSMSSYILGRMYMLGEGVEINSQDALGWFLLAIEQGYEIQKKVLDDLSVELSADEVNQSHTFVQSFPELFQRRMVESKWFTH